MKAAPHLASAIRYLHLEAQVAQSEQEFEDYSIALRFLGLLADGWDGLGLLNVACAYATGVPHGKFMRRRAEREEFRRMELARAIPDFDYSRLPRLDRDATDGRRHLGNKFASHGMDTQAIKEAAARLGMTEQAIYRRLKYGWPRERALSEPQRQGRKLYDGTEFCDLARPIGEGDDSIPSSQTLWNITPANQRAGDSSASDRGHPIQARPGPRCPAAVLAIDRRKPPKSVRSAAQRRHAAVAYHAALAYFGA